MDRRVYDSYTQWGHKESDRTEQLSLIGMRRLKEPV